ncbi:methyltransferase domain-containing protein [Nocardioides sp. L-11A]|uniref:methyltransferase domain-containing protein n=1 Tax=Nocardioides sp. L-11A TaxID=3043848 RepID=UPI00249A9E13|nr:methyltransferase domain-containing protein [Nocardioides sp. L-11A]
MTGDRHREQPVDERYYEVIKPAGLTEKLMIRARRRMYQDLVDRVRPTSTTRILDIGVSDVLGEGANFLEQTYPHRSQITAAGIGAAPEFQQEFPDIAYHQIVPNEPMPFSDRQFDVAVSNAVLEHVGSPANQQAFVAEALRVADIVFFTVPHRFFPVEHHTKIPFAHWSDSTFRVACRALGKQSWTDPSELILMSERRLHRAVPPAASDAQVGRTGLKLGWFSSNLFLYIDNRSQSTGGTAA